MSGDNKKNSYNVFFKAMLFTALAIILLFIGYFTAGSFFGAFYS